ncbi:MAG: polysaccharide deacetylase family protein [Cytophagales bacterium]|nr:polysaccharide deacetylase family protein [Cytophagales bacterium]
MSRVLQLIFIVITSTAFSQSKQVCFTIDDMPLVTYGVSDTVYQRGLMDKLIVGLTSNNIPAMGFVNEIKLYKNGISNPFQVQLLENWLNAGLELGNHTFSHPDYNSLSTTDFFKEIIRGELVTKELMRKAGKEFMYFRHPFLHEGNSKAKVDSLNQFLAENGYTVAPVTIDDEDYMFAAAYKKAQDKNNAKLMKQIGTDYINYMESKVLYFERQSTALFGRQISQILLIHASALNSDYIDALAQLFIKHKYDFISLKRALEDEAYKTPVTVYGSWGISWIDRWALSQGKKGDFFKGDPEIPS